MEHINIVQGIKLIHEWRNEELFFHIFCNTIFSRKYSSYTKKTLSYIPPMGTVVMSVLIVPTVQILFTMILRCRERHRIVRKNIKQMYHGSVKNKEMQRKENAARDDRGSKIMT